MRSTVPTVRDMSARSSRGIFSPPGWPSDRAGPLALGGPEGPVGHAAARPPLSRAPDRRPRSDFGTSAPARAVPRGAHCCLPNDADEIELGREDDGSLVIDLECRPPRPRRSADVEIEVFERWRPIGPDRFERVDYRFEIRHHELRYRRAFHRHDAERILRAFDVATHDHCEATLGHATCARDVDDPAACASDGYRRVYELWLSESLRITTEYSKYTTPWGTPSVVT